MSDNPLARSRLESTLVVAKEMAKSYVSPKIEGHQMYADVLTALYQSHWNTVVAAIEHLLNPVVTEAMMGAFYLTPLGLHHIDGFKAMITELTREPTQGDK